MQRAMNLTVGGTVATASLTLTATASLSSALDDGTANGMTFKLEACDQAWDETTSGGIPTYACAGTTSTVVAQETVHTLIATGHTGGGALTSNLDLTGVNHLRVTWGLPGAAGNSFQNLNSTIAVTFTTNQRAATNK